MEKEQLQDLIKIFLQTNPEPSDHQFHALAESLGIDREQLEAIAYEMLGQEVEGVSTHFPEGEGEDMSALAKVTARLKVTAAEEGLSEQQEVLQGEEDPDTTPTNDLALTDGAPVGDTMDDEIQDSLLNDGAGPDDTGLGIGAEKSMLLNDGAPALQLQNASTRLKASLITASRIEVVNALASKLKESGVKYELVDERMGGVEVKVFYLDHKIPASRIMSILKSTTLRELGKQSKGNYIYSYNKTSKVIGHAEYIPKDCKIIFD